MIAIFSRNGFRYIGIRLVKTSSAINWNLQPDVDYPFRDKTTVVTRCGRFCRGKKKINFSQVFAGQAAGIKEVHDDLAAELS